MKRPAKILLASAYVGSLYLLWFPETVGITAMPLWVKVVSTCVTAVNVMIHVFMSRPAKPYARVVVENMVFRLPPEVDTADKAIDFLDDWDKFRRLVRSTTGDADYVLDAMERGESWDLELVNMNDDA